MPPRLFPDEPEPRRHDARHVRRIGLLSDYEQLRVAPSQAYIKCQGITVGLPSDPINQACGNFYNGNSFTSNPAGIAVSAGVAVSRSNCP